MDHKLHIVCHEVPFPPSHGGLTDLFYKILALHKAGVRITLHCFQKRQTEAPELEKYCEKVFYYKRKSIPISFRLPYIVSSRRSTALINNLLADTAPVLLEGIHCTWPLFEQKIPAERTFVRLHNVEYRYYAQMARWEKNILKKQHFLREAKLLKQYEASLVALGATFLAVSGLDEQVYRNELHCSNIGYLPVFTGHDEVVSLTGTGDYCIYHGNLSVNENAQAAWWLADKIFRHLPYKLVVAGKNPPAHLKKALSAFKQVQLEANLTADEMESRIKNAQVQVLPNFNHTGIKLKVINALFTGRHCIVNDESMNIGSLCAVAETEEAFREKVVQLMETDFTLEKIQSRRSVLSGIFNDDRNAQKLIASLFPHYPTPYPPPF